MYCRGEEPTNDLNSAHSMINVERFATMNMETITPTNATPIMRTGQKKPSTKNSVGALLLTDHR